jgi:hypothetical protein
MKNSIRTIIFSGVALLLLTGALACSGSGVDPAMSSRAVVDSPGSGATGSRHVLWGMWDIWFDVDEPSLSFTPNREAQAHYNITEMILPPHCNDCISGVVNSFDPVSRVINADITLRNPYKISGYDVRGIIFTNDYGHHLLNADDWTNLYDIPCGQLLNPFKAFAKGEEYRLFAGETEHTENFRFYVPDPPNLEGISFAVDASWPGNCEEPYEIAYFSQEEIFSNVGSLGYVHVSVFDWQDDINKVILVAPEITGEQFTAFSQFHGDVWRLYLANNTGAEKGDYTAKVIATSKNSGWLALCDHVSIHISEWGVPVDPVDVTPPGFVIDAGNVTLSGKYAYVTEGGGFGGSNLCVVDITEPESPDIINWVKGYLGSDMEVYDGIMYVTGGIFPDNHLKFIDISFPKYLNIIKKVLIGWERNCFDIYNGYAYFFCVVNLPDKPTKAYISMWDIDPPFFAHLACEIWGGETWGKVYSDMEVSGASAFITMRDAGLWVMRVDPPEYGGIAQNICSPGGYYQGLTISGDTIYVAIGEPGLEILDIIAPWLICKRKIVDTPGFCKDVAVSGGYAYVADGDSGIQIIDIDPIESAYIVSSIDIKAHARAIAVLDGYAYVVATIDYPDNELRIIKLW